MNAMTSNHRLWDLLVPLAITLVCVLLYLPAAATLGLWEPWETAPATLARNMVEPLQDGAWISPFAVLVDNEIIRRSWLQAALLKFGYMVGGGTEFGLRMPFAMLNLLAALVMYGCLRLLYPAWRAGLVVLAWAMSPMILLSSVNLAGHAWAHAPLSVTMVAMGVMSSRPGRWGNLLVPLVGVGLGFSIWALGAPGFAVPVATLAAFAAGARQEGASPVVRAASFGSAALIFAAGILFPLWSTWTAGVAVTPEPGADVVVRTFSSTFYDGWQLRKDVVGLGFCFAGPLAALLAAAPGSRVSWIFHAWRTPLAVALLVGIAAAPITALWPTAVTLGDDALTTVARALLYGDFLTERTYPGHVTFDVLIRIVGFSVFPMVVLAPLGFGYLLHSGNDDSEQAPPDLAMRLFLAVWVAVGFAVFGLGASLARQYAFVITLPLVAAPVLALTDAGFIRLFMRNRAVWYTAAAVSLAILQVMKKDIQGNWDAEAGQAGPLVIFELLLADGSEQFPEEYTFQNVKLFVWGWRLALLALFLRPLASLLLARDSTDRFNAQVTAELSSSSRTAPGQAWLEFCALLASVYGLLAHRLAALLGARRDPDTGAMMYGGFLSKLQNLPGASLGLAAFLSVALLWSTHLIYRDVPVITEDFSQKSVLQTWQAARTSDEPLLTAGVDDNDTSYYLSDPSIVRLANMSDIRQRFCDAQDERVFVVVPAPRLSEAYYNVRRELGDDSDCAPQPLYVLYGISARYALVSNQLNPARNERHEGFLADNIFTEDTIPWKTDDTSGAERVEPPVDVDGKFELVGVQIEPRSTTGRGDVDIITYWRVLESPPSGYQAFIHADFGGNRVNGDHEMVGGNFPMNHWIPGEIVRDHFTINVGSAEKSGEYTVFFGFFRGDDRLAVTGERTASDNRIRLGTFRVR